MSNNPALAVRKASSDDPRVRRSTHALGAALIELLLEEHFDDITVQGILDRADVSRSTFYAHFRNKQDVLHSSYEGVFGWLERALDDPSRGARIVPVTEFLAHIADANRVVEALRRSGQLEEIRELSVGFLARMIERRIRPLRGAEPGMPPALVSRMLAGALLEMIKWWHDHPSSATPARMDAAFHAFARPVLERASYEPIA